VNAMLPWLEVRGPDGQDFTVPFAAERVTIGRLRDCNTVALEPDPQQLVTRQVHCLIERDQGAWWAVDNGSVNGTFRQRGPTLEVVEGRLPLADGDVIRILGGLPEEGEPRYWALTFRDPLKTRPVGAPPRAACLEYDWPRAKLFRVRGASREEIRGLRPQEHKLIRYMAQRNRANGHVPVLCAYEELIAAIWGEDSHHTEEEVNRLAWELRGKLEPAPRQPQLLQTERGLGYRLKTCPAAR
jgi:Transcriptional regulatory protein, C terminal/FHA domain